MVGSRVNIKRIKAFDLFEDISDEDAAELLKHLEVEEPAVGDYIIHEGRVPGKVFFIESGEMDVFKQMGRRMVRINTMGPGDYCGEISIILNCPATATVRAREKVRLLVFPGEVFRQFIERHKAVFFRIFKTTTERLSTTDIIQLRHFIDEFDFFYRKFLDVQRIWYFLPSELVARTLRGEMEEIEGGVLREVTVLFLDLRHYTFFAEVRRPEKVLSTLNEIFSQITNIITRNNGNVDKFLGDGLMAVFGNQTTPRKNAQNALAAAIESMEFLQRFNRDRYRRHEEEFYMGIGLNSGEAVFGNVGVENMMMNYTAIGDTVNVAARLCSLEGNNTVNLTEATYKLTYRKLKNFRVEKQKALKLRGRRDPVTVYQVTVP